MASIGWENSSFQVARSRGVIVNEIDADNQLKPQITARARLRPKAQLTLPDPIRQALHVSEGDEVEFAVHEDGVVTVRGFVSVPSEQAWRFRSGQQADG